ncbi:MAG: CPBP family intramembrane glutamic endopeptidase [Chlamydiota bacterium]
MDFKTIFFVALFGVAVNWYASRCGYFKAPSMKEESSIRLKFLTVLGAFAIYFGCTFLITSLMGALLKPAIAQNPIVMMNWIQIFTMTLSLLFLFIFARASIEKTSLLNIWKDKSSLYTKPVYYDMGIGILTWILAFPVVMVVGELSDLFIYEVLGAENYEQVAVLYLKMTSKYPSLLFIALAVILIVAPCIEEFLFRGLLQNFVKQYLGPKAAILLSSLGFAFFHMAPSQSLGNVSLVLSLFVFACFLGFVYEKQRSLFASISLHVVFNAVSTLRILLAAE